VEFIGKHLRVAEPGASTQMREAIAPCNFVLLDHAPRRRGFVRQFDG
jgi:hypothetical protein